MAQKRRMKRDKLYKKIIWYSHEMGIEITKNDVYEMFDNLDEMTPLDEIEALEILYDRTFKKWLDHKAPEITAKMDL